MTKETGNIYSLPIYYIFAKFCIPPPLPILTIFSIKIHTDDTDGDGGLHYYVQIRHKFSSHGTNANSILIPMVMVAYIIMSLSLKSILMIPMVMVAYIIMSLPLKSILMMLIVMVAYIIMSLPLKPILMMLIVMMV